MQIFLETGRLRLRQFTAADEDNLFELNSDPEVMRYINGGEPTPRAQIRDEILPFHARYYEKFPGFGTWAAEALPSRGVPRLVPLPQRGRRRRPGLPPAAGGVEPGVRHRGVARADPRGVHRPGRPAGVRPRDGGQRGLAAACWRSAASSSLRRPGPRRAGQRGHGPPGAGRGGVRARPGRVGQGAVGQGRAGPAWGRSPGLTVAQASARQRPFRRLIAFRSGPSGIRQEMIRDSYVIVGLRDHHPDGGRRARGAGHGEGPMPVGTW